jgi:hypothetical protein
MTLTLIRKDAWVPEEFEYKLRTWSPRTDLGRYIRDVAGSHLPPDVMGTLIEMMSKVVILQSSLSLKVIRGEWAPHPFNVEDYGVVGNKVITDAGVGFLVDAWQNSVELENMKYHAIGTGTTAEAATGAGAAMVTELTTEYNPNSTRATGTTTEASALVFRSVATNTLDAAPGAALREHGLISDPAVGSGVMWDRTLYAAITLASGDGLMSTYDMTGTSGG